MFDFMPKGKPRDQEIIDENQAAGNWQDWEKGSLPGPDITPMQSYRNQLTPSFRDISPDVAPSTNIFQNILGGVKWYGTHPGQLANEVGKGIVSSINKLDSLPLPDTTLNLNKRLGSLNIPLVSNFSKRAVNEIQKQQDFFKQNPVNTVPGMIGEQIPQIPLWMAGEGIVSGVTSKIPVIGKVAPKLPGIVKGGLKDAATYGAVVAPTESLVSGDGIQQFLDREKQLPSVALGGIALRGAGKALGTGLNTLNPLRKIGPELKQAELATDARLRSQNPLLDVQNAYKTPLQTKTNHLNPLELPKFEPKQEVTLPKLQVAATENNLGEGFGRVIPEPRIPMKLQQFNDTAPELPNISGHVVSKTVKEPLNMETAKNMANQAYIKTTDNLQRLNQLDKYVEDVTGNKLSPEDRSYMLGLNSRGSGSITSSILEENLVDAKGNVIGNPLKTITQQLKDADTANKFDEYLTLKHSVTRMRSGEKVFPDEMKMTPEKAELLSKEYEKAHPEFSKISQELYDFQNKLAKSWLVDTGIVSPEAFGKWVIDNPSYVPNQRLFSELEKPMFPGIKRGFAGQSNPVKARTGSQRKIISPLESIMEHVDQYVKVAKRNEVMQTVIRNLQKDPEALNGWAEIVPEKPGLKNDLVDNINEVLKNEGLDGVVEKFNKQFDEVFNAKKQRLDSGNIVTGLVDGNKVHVKINDPALLDALTNLKPQAQNVVIGALGQLTRVMKNLTTGINPVFSLTRNIFRDIPTAYTMSKSTNNPFAYGKDLLGAVVSVLKNDELYKSYKAIGGGYASSAVSTSRNALAESKARLLPSPLSIKQPGQMAKQIVTHPLNSTKRALSTGLGTLERLNNAVESAPRLAEFKRISKDGSYSSKVQGLFEANDVTTNFNKYGNIVKETDSVIPYLNAAWQGIDKLARAFREDPKQVIPKAFLSITIPTILLYQINHNNPAYQQLSDYIKDNNFLIPKPDGTFVKVPKPRELGVMFGSSVERSMRQWQDDDPEGFNRFMDTVKANFKPPARSVLAPFSDIRANKDFVKRPIVSGTLQRLSPSLQYDERTSEPAKFLGKTFNQSPQQIDYLARSYLGGLAQLGIPATTKNTTVLDTLKRQVTADPVYSNDIIGDFYDTKSKIDTGYSDYKATGDKSREVGSQYRSSFNKSADQLSDIRKEVDKIQVREDLSSSEKQKQLRELQIKMLEIAQKANSTFKVK